MAALAGSDNQEVLIKRHRLAILAAGVVAPFAVVSVASATSPAGVTPVAHVMAADLADHIKVNADGVKFQTKVPTEVSVLTLTVEPGGTTGWHSHPGLAVIAVSEGSGKLYSTDCSSQTYVAGQAFVEGGDDKPTMFSNESSSPVVLTVTFVAPRGDAIIHDEPAPACP